MHACHSCSMHRRRRHGCWCRREEESLAKTGGTKWDPHLGQRKARDMELQSRRAAVPARKRHDSAYERLTLLVDGFSK